MRVLLTGSDGYIGAIMAPYLVARGHEVVGLDTGFYRAGWLYEPQSDAPPTRFADIRRVAREDFVGFDAVIHLAELSNDPLGSHTRDTTFDINHIGSMNVARQAKAAGVRRFLYASSCSVYGAGSDDVKTETSAPNPQTAYAECKILCETEMLALGGTDFAVTALRNATAFGASPRMRFDIVLNNLSGLAWTRRTIAMTSDGTPWRPLVHVLDICKAFALALEAPPEAVAGEVFNVGADSQNYRVREIAEIVAAAFPGCVTSFGAPGPDNRSYQVSFAKIGRHLPEFSCEWTASDGARQLARLFERIRLTDSDFEAPPFTRLKELSRLIATGQIDAAFHWRARPGDLVSDAARAAA